MHNYDPGERSAKSLIDQIDRVSTPDWALEEGGIPLSDFVAGEVAIPVHIKAAPLEAEIPIEIENKKSQPLNEKDATELLFSELPWGQKGIEIIDIIKQLQGEEEMASLSAIHAHIKSLQEAEIISSEYFVDHHSLHDFLASALYCGLLGHNERRIPGQPIGQEGYFVPSNSNHEMFLHLARTCYEAENLAPQIEDRLEFFVDTMNRSSWPVSIEEYLGRMDRNSNEKFGSSLTAMCYAIWPSASELQLLKLEALTRCAIAYGIVEAIPAKNSDFKYLTLTEEGQKLNSRYNG